MPTDMGQAVLLGPTLQHSPGFADWPAVQNCSLGLTTCHVGRLILIGRKPDGSAPAHERLIKDCKVLRNERPVKQGLKVRLSLPR
jgi:hypothetical protein